MRRAVWVCVFALVAAVPAVGRGEKPLPLAPLPPPPPGFGPGAQPAGVSDANYKAPKADGAVVELLDEGLDALFPVLINDGGGEAGTATREDRDVFAGVEAARVTPMQKYRSVIPGWNFKIVETPKNPGEFRYLRFAWKKADGLGTMIQFHDQTKTWAMRYHAGANRYNWTPSIQVSENLPKQWEVHTRDMFKDYGALTITGFALTPLDGTSGLFDHMLLGRSVEDLDKATAAALGKVKPAKALERAEVDAHWTNLLGDDRVKAAAAQRALLATAPDHVKYIEAQLSKTAIDKDQLASIRKLIADLDADSFEARDTATEKLIKIGAPAADAIRGLAGGSSDEVRYRAQIILRKINGGNAAVGNAGRLARAVRVLERANDPAARELLAKLAEGEYGFDIAPDAKAALARLKTP